MLTLVPQKYLMMDVTNIWGPKKKKKTILRERHETEFMEERF